METTLLFAGLRASYMCAYLAELTSRCTCVSFAVFSASYFERFTKEIPHYFIRLSSLARHLILPRWIFFFLFTRCCILCVCPAFLTDFDGKYAETSKWSFIVIVLVILSNSTLWILAGHLAAWGPSSLWVHTFRSTFGLLKTTVYLVL